METNLDTSVKPGSKSVYVIGDGVLRAIVLSRLGELQNVLNSVMAVDNAQELKSQEVKKGDVLIICGGSGQLKRCVEFRKDIYICMTV